MKRIFLAVGLAVILGCHSSAQAAATAACGQALRTRVAAAGPKRDVSRDDLVRLRDIGQPEEQFGDTQLFTVSPDGTKIAFQVRRANSTTNDYCLGIYVAEVAPLGVPLLVDEGGELIRVVATGADRGAIGTGIPKTILPQWSPDSKQIAFLKRVDGVTQAWRAAADGTSAAALTKSTVDVEAVAWSADGSAITYTTRPGVAAQLASITNESQTGYLYDARFNPGVSRSPQVPGNIPTVFTTLTVANGKVRPAVPGERALLEPAVDRPAGAALYSRASDSSRVWTFALPSQSRIETGSHDPTQRLTTTGLTIETVGAWTVTCMSPVCDRIFGAWVDAANLQVLFARTQGTRGTENAIYRWRFGAERPEQLLATRDHIIGCDLAAAGLVCGQETPTQPRRLVLIDTNSGQTKLLFDPNPEFSNIRFGKVTQFVWRNSLGLEAFGQLVLPPGLKPGQHVPLVIVQYENRGFLRGGTGDEYPVHLLAANHIAVFAIDRPMFFGQISGTTDFVSINNQNLHDWNDIKSAFSSLQAGLDKVFATGAIDRSRVGISGLSNGMQLLQYAVINSKLFSAAIGSSCCNDESIISVVGPTQMRRLVNWGYPRPGMGEAFFKPMSLVQNVDKIDVPLLIQSADRELAGALPTVSVFQDRNKPIEMFIYPDEFHVKWQPSHRAAVYERNVDWFNFWLRCRLDPDPSKKSQNDRWLKMLPLAPERRCAKGDGRSGATTE